MTSIPAHKSRFILYVVTLSIGAVLTLVMWFLQVSHSFASIVSDTQNGWQKSSNAVSAHLQTNPIDFKAVTEQLATLEKPIVATTPTSAEVKTEVKTEKTTDIKTVLPLTKDAVEPVKTDDNPVRGYCTQQGGW